jgi:OOP family OmpA-OmpF porin
MSRKPTSLSRLALVAAFATLAFAPTMASAQTNSPDYWASPNSSVVRSGTGLCWHTTTWSAGSATANCDGVVATVAAAPEPVMTAAPVAVLAAAAPTSRIETRKITLRAEELFDFDKAVLRPSGKEALDKVRADLGGVDYSNIAVVGHTDRMGTSEYNQKLSERRAAAVSQYLVTNGVPSNKITASGKGETDPATKDCRGPMSKKLMACLQPDRRVEVAVSGSRDVTVAN